MKSVLAFLFSLAIVQSSCGQVSQPPSGQMGNFPVTRFETGINWSSSIKDLGNGFYEIKIVGGLKPGWHTYSKDIAKDVTPLPGSITFEPSKDYLLQGTYKESGNRLEVDEPILKEHYIEFTGEFTLTQKIKLLSKTADIKGGTDYQICNDKTCLPPATYNFEFKVTGSGAQQKEVKKDTTGKSMVKPVDTSNTTGTASSAKNAAASATDAANKAAAATATAAETTAAIAADFNKQYLHAESRSWWEIFFGGFLGGLLALITPCVYPMIPLTVSFFTKRSGNRKKGIANALTYGLSIILIYVALGFLVTKAFGSDALNDLASNVYFNMAFFIIFIIFAISFFGAFEIVLPSSWVNKSENLSDKGGLVGIFFMAFTLALVSFSCTGPIIGTLLVQAAVGGNNVGPLLGMFGFSLALALPFALFAMFPGWLQSLPKSGGWLNSVKIVFGFLELALAMKFFSNVDLAYHWHILDREVFLSLWIVIFALLGMYLIGRIKFAHDSELHYISIPRLFFAIVSFSFAIYIVPGLWGAPLKAISAFSPPEFTQDFDLTKLSATSGGTMSTPHKYSTIFHPTLGINSYFDYDEGIAAAQKEGKPVMLDFTGWSCFNCRKMEVSVWSDPSVLKRIKEDYILISMYVDDKTELPLEKQHISAFSGQKIRTLGNWYSDIEASVYQTNTQPLYALLDNEGKLLNAPRSYNQDIPAYVNWLDDGLAAYKKRNAGK